jgi:hypothetical protein
MAITTSGTTLTFNDATTQTTAPVNTNANVTSATALAGTGITISALTTTGAATHTVTNTGVTSVTAGTGISVSASTGGVTITNSSPGGVTSLNGNTGALLGYDKIASVTLSGNNSSVNITGIPSGYSNILVYCNFRVDNNGSDSVYPIRFSINNGSSYISTSNYYQQFQYNDNNTAVSYTALPDSGFAFAGVGGNGRGWIGGQTNYVQAWFIINQPTTTSYPGCTWNMGTFSGNNTDSGWYAGQGFLNSTNTYINAFQITRQSGNKNITGGYMNIFGTKVA